MVVPKSKYQGNSKQITTPQAAYELFTAIIKAEHKTDRDKEHFWAIGLNTRNNIKYIELVSLGTLSASLVHCREVFRMAIISAVSSLILVHNHPSGDPEPSEEDLRITSRLIDAGKIIGIQVLDHVIIGQGADGYKSFKEGGLL
jgi:DNA repair protein RadC